MSSDAPGPFSFPPDFAQAVAACRANRNFLTELAGLYRRVDEWARAGGQVCLGGGACCRFDRMDHRLYVTAGEFAYLLERGGAGDAERARRGRCPWQRGPRCLARDARPLGCRLHFCRGGHEPGDSADREMFHGLLGQLHETHCTPYRYAELASAACNSLF